MTPEEVLRPLLKQFDLPDSLVRLLYLLLQYEIENDYPSLEHAPDPAVRFAQGLLHIFQRLPKIYDLDDAKLYAPIRDLTGITESDISYLFNLRKPIEQLGYERKRDSLNRRIDNVNEVLADNAEIKGASKIAKPVLDKLKRELRELKEPKVAPYLASFWSKLLSFNVSFDIPKRNRHCHIMAAYGTGKTTLIKRLIHQDIQSGASVIVMAPKGDLIETAAQFPSDRTIWIKDWSQVGLNLSDLSTQLIVYVFEALLESEPTPRQKAFLMQYVPKIRSLSELRNIKDKNYEDMTTHINWRLDLLPKVIDGILSRPTNINIEEIMNSGKVLLLDTKYLDEGSSLIGRFFIALIARATPKRTSKTPVYVYIDEAQLYLTEYMEQLLDTAREANVGLTICHQSLSQISPRLAASLHNTATKFVGKCNSADAGAMARELRVDANAIQDLPDYTFFLSAFNKPFPISIPEFAFTASQQEHFVSPRLALAAEPDAPYSQKGDSEDPKDW